MTREPFDESSGPGDPESVPLDTWRRLYELAARVGAMEPWNWMEETDVFGVQVSNKNEPVFVSVMGLLGEYRAVALYPDARTLDEFWRIQNAPNRDLIANMLSGLHYVQTAFGKKSELEREEKDLVRQLGVTFKGAHAWPRFLSFRPGWFPWRVDAQEASWLVEALPQLLNVAPRLQTNRRLLGTGGAEHQYLIRTRAPHGGSEAWTDTYAACPPPAATVRITIPNRLLDAIRALDRSECSVELDVVPSYTAVGSGRMRPQMPYLMLAVEPASRFILGVELLSVESEMDGLWAQVPTRFLELLLRSDLRPASVALRTPRLFTVLEGVCKDLGMQLVPDPELAALSEVRQDLDRYSRGHGRG